MLESQRSIEHVLPVLVIIPAYNEEKRIDDVLTRTLLLKRLYSNLDVMVIDDGSKDGTAEIAKSKNVITIRHKKNQGEEGAIQTGFQYALDHGYEFVVKIDADGQHIPEEITKILRPLLRNEADVVIGSRVAAYLEKPRLFRLGRVVCAVLFAFVTQKKISDTTSGFKARNRTAFRYSRMQYLRTRDLHSDMVNDIEELILYSKRKMRIREVSVNMNKRENASKCYFSYRLLKFPFVFLATLTKHVLTREAPGTDVDISS